MKNYRNIIGGRQAKARGDAFENILATSASRTNWDIIKIPLGAKQVSADRLIRVQTPFDFVFIKKEKVIFCDSKTTKNKTFTFSSITNHQLKELLICESHGHKSGYIVNFTEYKKTVFFSATQLNNLQKNNSLRPSDGILVGENYIINLDRIYTHSTMTQSSEKIG